MSCISLVHAAFIYAETGVEMNMKLETLQSFKPRFRKPMKASPEPPEPPVNPILGKTALLSTVPFDYSLFRGYFAVVAIKERHDYPGADACIVESYFETETPFLLKKAVYAGDKMIQSTVQYSSHPPAIKTKALKQDIVAWSLVNKENTYDWVILSSSKTDACCGKKNTGAWFLSGREKKGNEYVAKTTFDAFTHIATLLNAAEPLPLQAMKAVSQEKCVQ